jgi:ATP-dependent RNA helicase DDX3X
MSGWGNDTTDQVGGDDWGQPVQKNPPADTWGVTANGDGDDAKPAPRPAPFVHRDTPAGQWEKTKAYDYEAFNNDGAGKDWDGNAQVYYWDGNEGDIGPKSEGLEIMLFGKPEERDPGGDDFNK